MTFNTAQLTGERVLVKGTDSLGNSGQTVLDSSQWNQVKAQRSHAGAHDQFDAAVEEFFAPLTKAAELLEVGFTQPVVDEAAYVTIREGVDGTEGQSPVVAKLNHDSIVLRLLEEGKHERLVWVNDDLEVLAPTAPAPQVDEVEVLRDAGL